MVFRVESGLVSAAAPTDTSHFSNCDWYGHGVVRSWVASQKRAKHDRFENQRVGVTPTRIL